MKKKNWFRLSFFEQLSNIAGEVNRLVENEEQNDKEYEAFYLNKIKELIDATFQDPKNDIRRKKELEDEYNQILEYLDKKYSASYITDYWQQYTDAIS